MSILKKLQKLFSSFSFFDREINIGTTIICNMILYKQ